MDSIRHMWGTMMASFFAWMGRAWAAFFHGLTESWQVKYFILAMGIVVIAGAAYLWRKRA